MKVRRSTVVLGAVALFLFGATLVLWSSDGLVADSVAFARRLWEDLARYPFLLYAAIVVLPALPIPQSPFLVLAGLVYAESFGGGPGAALAASAVALNILWTYFLTAGPLRRLAQRILGAFGYRLPVLPREDRLKFAFLVRVTPVLPLCVQNYTLGVLRIPLHLYLLASWTTQVPLAFAIALTAGAILEGNLALVLFAVAAFLFLALGLKWLRRRLRKDPELEKASGDLVASDPPPAQPEKP